MKLSSSLLPIALSSTALAQRHGAEFKRIHTLRGASPDDVTPSGAIPRRNLSDADDVQKCLANKDRDGCNGQDICTWCESKAVASACYPTQRTAQLAQSVFKCDSVSLEREAPSVDEAEPEKKPRVQTSFNLKEGITLTMSSDVVDKDFCDGSSTGMAGYMSVQGSQFDTDNDKHLFFWMKEKRSVSQIPKSEENDVDLTEGWWPFDSPGKDKPLPQPQPQPKPETKPDAAPAAPVDDPNTPLIVWLTGGPGCSSSLALLKENGPCTVNDDGASTSVNPYSWTGEQSTRINLSYVLYL